jgi:hypothetical protein
MLQEQCADQLYDVRAMLAPYFHGLGYCSTSDADVGAQLSLGT